MNYNPFDLTEAEIRNDDYVLVTRKAAENGQGCVYQKQFKAGFRDGDYWIERENGFLLDFTQYKKLQHTVKLARCDWENNDQETSVKLVVTNDAGVTIQDWLQVQAEYLQGETLAHPFKCAGQFLSLLRACLIALKEIHQLGIVHCDIKKDNICLPYKPYPMLVGQPVHIDFEHIRLIDFAFSICPERPLKKALPIAPTEATPPYQSDLLKAALTHDRALRDSKRFAAQELDYRVDFYSLAYLFGKIIDDGLRKPDGEDGLDILNGAYHLVEQLNSMAKAEPQGKDALPHDGLIAEIDQLLAKLKEPDKYRVFNVETHKFDPQSYTPTPLTAPTHSKSDNESITPIPPTAKISDEPLKHKKTSKKPWVRHVLVGLAVTGAIGAISVILAKTVPFDSFQAEKPTTEQQLAQIKDWLDDDSDKSKWPQAVAQLEPLAKSGNTKASNLLASSYHWGLGVKIDIPRACQLYQQAIDANNTDKKKVYDETCKKT